MKMSTACLLTVAVAGLYLAGCQADESAPSRPRVKAILPTDDKGRDNAEKRELEAPKRDMPTAGSEFPGQSRADVKNDGRMVTLVGDMYGSNYSGPLPHLPQKPGMTPAVGYTAIPGSPWVIEHSWGESLPLADYAHRAWPDTKTEYVIANQTQNPTYVLEVPVSVPKPQCDAGKDAVTTLVGVPWFYVNTLAMPALMCLEAPWQEDSMARLGRDPLYFGYLPPTGTIVPSPAPGEFKFDYKFESNATQATTAPAK